jgi:hypothetical protein
LNYFNRAYRNEQETGSRATMVEPHLRAAEAIRARIADE